MKNKCSLINCKETHHAKGYCQRHYVQYKRYGRILKRTCKDPNEIVIYKGHAEVTMYNKNSNEVARAIIDKEEIFRISKYKWHFHRYAKSKNKDGSVVYMHRLVKNAPKGTIVDHINGDTLDNRKNNLRFCTVNENARNLVPNYNSDIPYRGINRSGNKYAVTIGHNNKKYYIGLFKTLNEAINARIQAEIKYWGKQYTHILEEAA